MAVTVFLIFNNFIPVNSYFYYQTDIMAIKISCLSVYLNIDHETLYPMHSLYMLNGKLPKINAYKFFLSSTKALPLGLFLASNGLPL